ncbi:MAG: hypothetical protein LBP36_03245 [Oscillospiraceae bacterium]|jgi:hypothetical protein|nr:hypothetical protein [Oscillospiraceae bacterium]
MAGTGIFRKNSLERVSSPERLNEYIKVANPSLFLIFAAMFAIVLAGAAWIFTGNIPKYSEFKGVVVSQTYPTLKNEKEVYAFLEIGNAQEIKEGMEVRISPQYAPPTEYGYISGSVKNVGSQIITERYLVNKFPNPNIVSPVLSQSNVNLVEIEITLGSWTNEKGKSIEVADGSICNISVTIDKQPAYKLILNI